MAIMDRTKNLFTVNISFSDDRQTKTARQRRAVDPTTSIRILITVSSHA
jgi:hypothetical protein